jgi:hypothetical protein
MRSAQHGQVMSNMLLTDASSNCDLVGCLYCANTAFMWWHSKHGGVQRFGAAADTAVHSRYQLSQGCAYQPVMKLRQLIPAVHCNVALQCLHTCTSSTGKWLPAGYLCWVRSHPISGLNIPGQQTHCARHVAHAATDLQRTLLHQHYPSRKVVHQSHSHPTCTPARAPRSFHTGSPESQRPPIHTWAAGMSHMCAHVRCRSTRQASVDQKSSLSVTTIGTNVQRW